MTNKKHDDEEAPEKPEKAKGGMVDEVVNVAIQAGLLDKLLSLLTGLLHKKPKVTPPTAPIDKPVPRGDGDDHFPDDFIPVKKGDRVPTKLHYGIAKAEYSRERFPEQFTPEKGNGLIDQSFLRRVEKGLEAIPWGSKVWLDGTLFDQYGREFLPDAVIAYGLAYATEHHFGSAFIVGLGADANGQPKGGYTVNDTEEIGQGISAWLYTKGFMQQFKAQPAADGQQFEVYFRAGGVSSEVFTIKVS